MDLQLVRLLDAMMQYEQGCPKRIHHFMKVFGYVQYLCEKEAIDEATKSMLHATAIIHDIGIRPSIEKYGLGNGIYQQIEGPIYAKEMLSSLQFAPDVIERICYLIAHHHTFHNIHELDYQILVEADFLVNIEEKKLKPEVAATIRDRVFKTPSGIQLLTQLYLS